MLELLYSTFDLDYVSLSDTKIVYFIFFSNAFLKLYQSTRNLRISYKGL